MLAIPALALLLTASPDAGADAWRHLEGRAAERAILRLWDRARPGERAAMRARLERIDRARRFVDARPVLVPLEGGARPLAEVFRSVLEPALDLPLPRGPGGEPEQWRPEHRRALAALDALRTAYAPPAPASTGTLNLLLTHAADALSSPVLPIRARVRYFVAVVEVIRSLEDRVRPDARSAWLIDTRLLPALVALGRIAERDPALGEAVAEAGSLFFLPSLLDFDAQARLAPLTRGVHSRRLLVRAYRDGALDRAGIVALARSTTLEARGDPTWLAGAAPLMLELLGDPAVPPRERADLAAVAAERMAESPPLRPLARELLAAALGVPPAPLDDLRRGLDAHGDRLPHPEPGPRAVRFLRVMMAQPDRDHPPRIVAVDRTDARVLVPLRGGDGRFAGMLVPSGDPGAVDFLGPAPALGERTDNRLVRRRLHGERIAATTFGLRSGGLELCAALPEDSSEPVPSAGATLADVVGLIDRRLRISSDGAERAALVGLLVRVGTPGARAVAAREARSPAAVEELLPLVERGDEAAALALVRDPGRVPPETFERHLESALLHGHAAVVARARALASSGDPAVACIAADVLMSHGDASGVLALCDHPDRAARACAGALAIRATGLAKTLGVTLADEGARDRLAARAAVLFGDEADPHWRAFADWIGLALRDPEAVHAARRDHDPLFLGSRQVSAYEFATWWREAIGRGDERVRRYWDPLVVFLLDPSDPGRGLAADDLRKLLDALEGRVGDGVSRDLWLECHVLLACAQHAMAGDTWALDLAQHHLSRAAGDPAPPGVARKPGVYWPIWLARAGPAAGSGED